MKITLTILVLIFSINATAQNKMEIVPLIKDAPSPKNTIYVKSNGVNIGVLIGYGINSRSEFNAMNSKEYVFTISATTGRQAEHASVVYANNDCTDPAYTEADSRRISSTGEIITVSTSGPVFYKRADNVTEKIQTGSSLYVDDSGVITCIRQSAPKTITAYPLIINDPAVTGVQDSYDLPISIGF